MSVQKRSAFLRAFFNSQIFNSLLYAVNMITFTLTARGLYRDTCTLPIVSYLYISFKNGDQIYHNGVISLGFCFVCFSAFLMITAFYFSF